MPRSPAWYLGYDLKRMYQRNLLIGMALVYGGAIASGIVLWALSTTGAITERTRSFAFGGAAAGSGTDERAVELGMRKMGRGTAPTRAPEQRLVGLFALGREIRIIRDDAAPVQAVSYRPIGMGELLPDEEMAGESGEDDTTLAGSGGGGEGLLGNGLPGPASDDSRMPRFADWEMRRQLKGRTRSAKVFFGSLTWPKVAPQQSQCTAFVAITFFADGHFDWNIKKFAIDTTLRPYQFYFEAELKAALRRTWFESAMVNGVKVTQEAELQAIFCPNCKSQAWSERGDMEVTLAR
jgi:hypothetical protein